MARIWYKLPIDILNKVVEHLSHLDLCHISAVCRSWWAVPESVQLSANRQPSPCLHSVSPWCKKVDGKTVKALELFDCHINERIYWKHASDRRRRGRAHCQCSTSFFKTRLLFSKVENSSNSGRTIFFYFNPFCNQVLEIPPLDLYTDEKVYNHSNFS
ncbi:hypothetical protein ACFX2I_007466 [Malus domestica]